MTEDGHTDGQMAFQLYIVDVSMYVCIFCNLSIKILLKDYDLGMSLLFSI